MKIIRKVGQSNTFQGPGEEYRIEVTVVKAPPGLYGVTLEYHLLGATPGMPIRMRPEVLTEIIDWAYGKKTDQVDPLASTQR